MNKFKVGDKVRVCVGYYVGIPKGTILSVVADGTLGAYWIAGGYAEVGTVNVYHCEFELVEAAQESNETPSLVHNTTHKNDDSSERDSQPSISNNAWFERKELPEVGTVCEATENGEWREVKILAHTVAMGFDVAVYQYEDVVSYSSHCRFRPIKTAEEIEAEKREKAVNQMMSYAKDGETLWDVFCRMYNDGWRKLEE